jgi:hypothetical protein
MPPRDTPHRQRRFITNTLLGLMHVLAVRPWHSYLFLTPLSAPLRNRAKQGSNSAPLPALERQTLANFLVSQSGQQRHKLYLIHDTTSTSSTP